MTDLSAIYNFVALTDNVGTSGQPTREQIADIAAAGYDAVVNLAMHDSENALADEGSLVSSAGMRYFHMPIDFAAPTAEDAQLFIKVMQSLAPRRVFVHCAMNLRVSAFMYLYLRHACGLSEEDARSPILPKWEPRMDAVWRDFLALPAEEIGLKKGAS